METTTTHGPNQRVAVLTPPQANAAVLTLAPVVLASDIADCTTWHNGLGADECEFCEALVILRHAAGYTPRDHLRP
jgi:hypothetical protein